MVRCGGGKSWLKVIRHLEVLQNKAAVHTVVTRINFSPLNVKADVGRNPKCITGEK